MPLSSKRRDLTLSMLILYPKVLEKEETEPNISRKKEITKIKAEINECRKAVDKNQQNGILFFERTKKIGKPLASLRQKKYYLNKPDYNLKRIPYN
jgi:hypothetical protein